MGSNPYWSKCEFPIRLIKLKVQIWFIGRAAGGQDEINVKICWMKIREIMWGADHCIHKDFGSIVKLKNESGIFWTFWKLLCVTKSLFFELETSNFGYLLIYFFAELFKVYRKIQQHLCMYIRHFFTRVTPMNFW